MRSASLPLILGCLALLSACGGGGSGTPTAPVGPAPTSTPSPAASPSAVADDAALYRLVTQTEPFSGYTPFPNAEEFTTGRLVGSEAHRPVVRVTLNARASSVLVGGRFPTGGRFPDGSIVFKEIRTSAGAMPNVYALMYRDQSNPSAANGWLWAEYGPSGTVVYSIRERGAGCVGCHLLGRGRENDLVRTFERQQ